MKRAQSEFPANLDRLENGVVRAQSAPKERLVLREIRCGVTARFCAVLNIFVCRDFPNDEIFQISTFPIRETLESRARQGAMASRDLEVCRVLQVQLEVQEKTVIKETLVSLARRVQKESKATR